MTEYSAECLQVMFIEMLCFCSFSSDVQCGRIQCQGGSDRPLIDSNAKILKTTVKLNHSEFTCRGAYFHLGDDVSDPAMVAQGTACAPGKVRVFTLQLRKTHTHLHVRIFTYNIDI